MKLIHLTTKKNALSIQINGFRDSIISTTTDLKTGKIKPMKGVFFSNTPFDRVKNINGKSIELDTAFMIDFPDEIIKRYSITHEDRHITEWLIPTKIVNKYFKKKKIYPVDDDRIYENSKNI